MSKSLNKEAAGEASPELLRYFWRVLVALVAGLGAFLTLVTAFVKPSPFTRLGYLGTATLLLVLLYVAMILTAIRMAKLARNSDSDGERDLPEILAEGLKRWSQEKRFNDVVRVGSEISRSLWLSGHYKERVEIGKLVEDAASKTGAYKQQVAALIDDVGWTLAMMDKMSAAEENIEVGVKKAVDNQLYYLAAKGERHLAGISSRKGDKKSILDHLDKALGLADSISNPDEKSEMLASLELAKGEYLLETGKPEEAMTSILAAQSHYGDMREQSERRVKVHSRLGNIYLALNDYQQAKDQFNEGYRRSLGIRDDEVARNLLGLGRVFINKPDVAHARESLIEAKEIFDRLGMIKEAQTTQDLLSGLGV